jgi:hypothetical protein
VIYMFSTRIISTLSAMIQSLLCLQIPHLRPAEYKRSRLSRNRRTVNRAYGGVLSGGAVRERCFFLNPRINSLSLSPSLVSVCLGCIK